MQHPVLENPDLRLSILNVLRHGYSIRPATNIVFVCGGADESSCRKRFRSAFQEKAPEFRYYEPEYSMEHRFSRADSEPFDIGKFEAMVGSLAHAIVIFPESPGSIAETGYFAAIPSLAKKTILVLDVKRQRSDSFISLGPAKRIQDSSRFHPNIQTDYEEPDFLAVLERIRRYTPDLNREPFSLSPGRIPTTPELLAAVFEIVRLLRAATISDVESLLHEATLIPDPGSLLDAFSILVGMGELQQINHFGQYCAAREVKQSLEALPRSSAEIEGLQQSVFQLLNASDYLSQGE